MNTVLANFAAHLRERISHGPEAIGEQPFGELALALFAVQCQHNAAYQQFCRARQVGPGTVKHWTQIPAVPTLAFKELELSCLPPAERTTVFHSSGTTGQKPSCHFHSTESLSVYAASLWSWFGRRVGSSGPMVFLTPDREAAPHSSLIYMFETLRQKLALPKSAFAGSIDLDGAWLLDFPAVLRQLRAACDSAQPLTMLGTAFSFVHLLDYLGRHNVSLQLPAGSRVMETGGYKNRSRTLPRTELHALITARLGVPPSGIICEYGMSELSSQAYAVMSDEGRLTSGGGASHHSSPVTQPFRFPPWARVQIISPETGREVGEGQSGIVRVLDLANVFSVAAVQTEDLGIRRGDGFELIGRAEKAEPRGCSLMAPESLTLA